MDTSALHTDEARAKSRAVSELTKRPDALMAAMNMPQLGQDRQRVLDRTAEMPQTCRRTYLRAMKGRSMKAAIKSHCFMCMGWLRAEVPLCSDPACPLYPYRPGA